MHLELVRLQFALPGFGCESRHIRADGDEAFDVGVENDGRDETAGGAHRHTHIHHVIPGEKQSIVR